MQHIPWNGDMAEFPEPLRRYLRPGHVFDSSSSAEATVYYSDIGQGCYIKKARHGALRNEAAMTRYFHDKGLAAAVLHYGQDHDSNDWLATACLPGDDCTASLYVREPERLAAVLGRRLRMLHEQDPRKTIWRQWSGIMRRDVRTVPSSRGSTGTPTPNRYIAWCGSMATNCVTIRCCMVIIACRMSYLTIGGSAVSLIWIAPESATDMWMCTGLCGRYGSICIPMHTATAFWMPTDVISSTWRRCGWSPPVRYSDNPFRA